MGFWGFGVLYLLQPHEMFGMAEVIDGSEICKTTVVCVSEFADVFFMQKEHFIVYRLCQ